MILGLRYLSDLFLLSRLRLIFGPSGASSLSFSAGSPSSKDESKWLLSLALSYLIH